MPVTTLGDMFCNTVSVRSRVQRQGHANIGRTTPEQVTTLAIRFVFGCKAGHHDWDHHTPISLGAPLLPTVSPITARFAESDCPLIPTRVGGTENGTDACLLCPWMGPVAALCANRLIASDKSFVIRAAVSTHHRPLAHGRIHARI